MRVVMLLCASGLLGPSAYASESLFVGTFESEAKENMGTGTPGEWRITIAAPKAGKYASSTFRNGKLLESFDLVECSSDMEDSINNRPPGRTSTLCIDPVRTGGSLSGFISFVENGIYGMVPKQKYLNDSSLIKKEGLKPGDPKLFEARAFRAKYYAHAQWMFLGFRKVSP